MQIPLSSDDLFFFLAVGGTDSLVPSSPRLAALGRGTVCGYETVLRHNNNKRG